MAGALTVAAAVAYGWVSVFRHDHFASNAFDLGIQDQTVWGYSQLQIIPNTVLGVPNLLGDHFNPILVVLAPFYRIWDSPSVLLVAQAILLAVAGVPVFLWGVQRLGAIAALAFQASYLLFWGVLAGVIYDFHHVVFAVPAVAFALYAALNRHNRLLWAMVAICYLVREDITITLMGLGVYVAVVQRRFVLGAALAVFSGAWLLLLLKVVMPVLSGGPYRHWLYPALGSGPFSALWHVITHPVSSVELLFRPYQKTKVWFGTLVNWMFLPLLSPIFFVALPALLERFWSSTETLWSFHFQYSMLEAPILTFAAIDSTARVVAWLRHAPRDAMAWKAIRLGVKALPIGAACVAISLVLSFGLIKPMSELGTYVSDGDADDIQTCLNVIPPNASVSASSFLLPHLSHRKSIYLVTDRMDTQYIAINVSTYHEFAPGEEQQLKNAIEGALDTGYGVVCSKGLTVVLERGATDPDLSPQLEKWLYPTECGAQGCLVESAHPGGATGTQAQLASVPAGAPGTTSVARAPTG